MPHLHETKAKMPSVLRILNGIMLVLFVSWAGFQYNDPDPLIWIAVYGFAALGCLLFFLRQLPRQAAWAYVGLCIIGALYLLVRVIVGREFIFDEQGREMMGLLISAAWIGFLSTRPRASDPRASELQTP